jgi:hypothetical protein
MVGHRSWYRIVLVVLCLTCITLACNLGDSPGDSAVDPQAPLVLLLAPVNGSVIAEGATIALHAIAQDMLAGVARIEFRANEFPVGEVLSDSPGGQPSLDAIVQWTATGTTGHLITVEAFRADGASLGFRDVVVRVVDQPRGQVAESDGTSPTAPTAAPAPTEPASPPTLEIPLTGVTAQINTPELNVRQGPGTNYPTVGTLRQGEQVQIVGRNTDSTWWAIAYSSGIAWVFAELTIPDGDVSQVPLVAAP